MGKAILGEKLGMTQVFKEDRLIPVTVVKAGPCVVTQLKTRETDGYEAVQVGFGEIPGEKAARRESGAATRRRPAVNRPMEGHFARAGAPPQRFLAELQLDPREFSAGQRIKVDEMFAEGDHADVCAVSKGKGFAGVIKRHGFSGGPGSHGSRFHRAPGAVGQCATPSRVFKGKKLPGHMGTEKVTALNLLVVEVDPDRDLLLLRGSVPGPKGARVIVRQSVKTKAGKAKR
ncbi:MAG: 50S ribosomal protein L3 [Actinobacteria bacterium]|nr:50S ribosomal protein L3 [Actinomycetota bacterium]MBU1943048.1 50S ribosomal protein L3 [Actinomycetota bacterium]MBU2686930.1 50S ribosomal protein L3 [Actinomycetota bacterium]